MLWGRRLCVLEMNNVMKQQYEKKMGMKLPKDYKDEYDYFKSEFHDLLECKLCGKHFEADGDISLDLIKHLKTDHKIVVKKCQCSEMTYTSITAIRICNNCGYEQMEHWN
jgi:hypothetical protein